jgi:hypothetical protein
MLPRVTSAPECFASNPDIFLYARSASVTFYLFLYKKKFINKRLTISDLLPEIII